MARAIYDVDAPKKPVNLYLNSDLVKQAKALGGNLSERVERLLAQEVEIEHAKNSDERIQAAIASSNAFIEKYGWWGDEYSDN